MVVSLFDFYRYGFKSKDVNVANQTLLFFYCEILSYSSFLISRLKHYTHNVTNMFKESLLPLLQGTEHFQVL